MPGPDAAALRTAGAALLVGAALRRLQAGHESGATLLLEQLLDDELAEALTAATALETAVLAELARRAPHPA